jgi:hypothetical protein
MTVYIRTLTDGSRPQPYQFINLSIHIWRHTNSPAEKPSLDIPTNNNKKVTSTWSKNLKCLSHHVKYKIILRVFFILLKLRNYKDFFLNNSHPIAGLDMSWRFHEVEAHRLHDSRHTKVVKFVSPTHRPPLLHRKHSWYSFLLETGSTPGL